MSDDRDPSPADALRRVRARIARAILDADDTGGSATGDAGARLGEVTLRPHQRDALARVRAACATFGGALLADEAGMGKSYVALALARDARAPLLVAPAGTRDTWREAMRRAGVTLPMVTHEALSRRGAPAGARHDLLVVDEAHHARARTTRRWRALAALAAGARVLLLSATPLHNRRDELGALLALFMGERARAAPDELIARVVVRRERRALAAGVDEGAPPRVLPVRRLRLSHDDALLDAIVALPPPLGVDDDGPTALLLHGLVRQWASSEGALRATLRRRLARALVMDAALAQGRVPDAATLRGWASGEDAAQLSLLPLMQPPDARAPTMRDAVLAHARAIRALLARLDDGIGRDAERAARLLQLRRAHPGDRVVAFTGYAATVRALWRLLRHEPGIAALTAAGGMVAGGPMSRDELLARVAPRAHGRGEPSAHERVSLLLTTDLASEGVNLQDAGVVVHLDLPWTPARLEQRVGRLARLGSPHDAVHVYAMMPPASAERVLAVEARLRAKLREAARAVGVAGAIVPGIAVPVRDPGAEGPRPTRGTAVPRLVEELRTTLRRWEAEGDPGDATDAPGAPGAPRVAVVRAAHPGALVLCVAPDGTRHLLAVRGYRAGDAPDALWRAVVDADGAAADVVPIVRDILWGNVARVVARWHRARTAAEDAGVTDLPVARLRREALLPSEGSLARAPRHRRGEAARAADAARARVLAARGAYEEASLEYAHREEGAIFGTPLDSARPGPPPPDAGTSSGDIAARVRASGIAAPLAMILILAP